MRQAAAITPLAIWLIPLGQVIIRLPVMAKLSDPFLGALATGMIWSCRTIWFLLRSIVPYHKLIFLFTMCYFAMWKARSRITWHLASRRTGEQHQLIYARKETSADFSSADGSILLWRLADTNSVVGPLHAAIDIFCRATFPGFWFDVIKEALHCFYLYYVSSCIF
jgi:hypothetical protein